MDVWIDVHTPKQALFFWPIADILKSSGVNVLITTRRYEQVLGVMEGLGMEAKVIGSFGGGEMLNKLRASSERQLALLDLIADDPPSIALSSGSVEMCRICYGLGIRHILVSDSPHSPVNRMCAPLSDLILTPKVIPLSEWRRYLPRGSEIERYDALDPAAWISRLAENDLEGQASLGEGAVLIRTPECQASYLLGRGIEETATIAKIVSENFGGEVIIMPRYKEEVEALRERLKSGAVILERPVIALPLIRRSRLFIGGGGTMTQEAALLGKPTIMFYPAEPPAVHKFLMRRGLITYVAINSINELPNVIERLLRDEEGIRERASKLLRSMEDPAKLVAERVLKLLKK